MRHPPVRFNLFLSLALGASLVLLPGTPGADDSGARSQVPEFPTSLSPSDSLSLHQLRTEIAALEAEISAATLPGPYIVIVRTQNRLELREGRRVLEEWVCATGSGRVLLGDKGRSWSFETPRGVYTIRRKVKDPVWSKPEWAFVETGTPVPVLPWMFERLDAATLGDYALQLGDGYEIHGTLYPSLLGRNITHGCIRLNDANLEELYSRSRVGTAVIIY